MSNITLIMTRKPLEEVNFGKKNGRWGRMVVVMGGEVLSGSVEAPMNLPDVFSPSATTNAGGAFTDYTDSENTCGEGTTKFRIGSQGIRLDTFGGPVEVIGRFDILERFRTDSDKSKFYVQLKPRTYKPYQIKMDISKTVKELNGTGQCFRVLNHDTMNSKGGMAGILIHEAPHPGWLIGCIGPRPANYRFVNHDKGPSRSAMQSIFNMMGGFKSGKKAELLTLDI
ncbi:MAG: hypothetical protein AB7Q37_17730 [Pyrinomonadaceae bacterium]